MREDAADAGFYEGPWGQHYPRLQLLTVGDLLDGRRIDMPDTASMAANVTHRRAPKSSVRVSAPCEILRKAYPRYSSDVMKERNAALA
jgi:hypothetical protein